MFLLPSFHCLVFSCDPSIYSPLGIRSFRPQVVSPPVVSPPSRFAPSRFAPKLASEFNISYKQTNSLIFASIVDIWIKRQTKTYSLFTKPIHYVTFQTKTKARKGLTKSVINAVISFYNGRTKQFPER